MSEATVTQGPAVQAPAPSSKVSPASGEIPIPTVSGSSAVMDPTVAAVLNQAFAKSHESWLGQQDQANAGNGNVGEQTRLAYLIDRANLALAGDILASRSSQSQPQQGGTFINPGSIPPVTTGS